MRSRFLLTGLLLGVLLSPAPLTADDGAPKTEVTRSEAFAIAVTAMPAPSSEGGYVFDAVVYMGDTKLGPAQFKAASFRDGEQVLWQLTEGTNLMEGTFRTQQAAVLTPTLRLVKGTLQQLERRRVPAGTEIKRTKVAWKVKERRVEAHVHRTGTEDQDVVVEVASPILPGLGGVMLFAQHCKAEDATYECPSFDVTDIGIEGKQAVETIRFQVHTGRSFDTRPAIVLERLDETEGSSFVYVDPKTRAILAVERTSAPGRPPMRMVAANVITTPQSAFAGPATSAKEAASRAAYALFAKHEGTLNAITHWSTVHALMKEQLTEPVAVATFRERMLASLMLNLRKTAPSTSPAKIRAILNAAREDLVLTDGGGGVTLVTFPQAFNNLQLKVGKKDGAWYLVRLPGM